MNFHQNSLAKLSLLAITATSVLIGGCQVSAKNEESAVPSKAIKKAADSNPLTDAKNSVRAGRIKFEQNSPADAVSQFYKNLREKRFREALMMTNLRPAVEGLSDAEIQDLSTDFAPLAAKVPADLQINGEIITGDKATVTVKMPNEDTGVLEDRLHSLKRENGNWIYLMANDATEKAAQKEGKNYFFALRLDVHHAEVQSVMENIAKAQMVYALQNGGMYTDLQTLVVQNLLPEDTLSEASTGYRFSVQPSSDKKKYWATAEPAAYGKSGKLSFLMEFSDKDNRTKLKSEDNKGAPLKSKKS